MEIEHKDKAFARIRIATDDGHILDLHQSNGAIILNSNAGLTTSKGKSIVNQHLLPDLAVRALMDWLNRNFNGE